MSSVLRSSRLVWLPVVAAVVLALVLLLGSGPSTSAQEEEDDGRGQTPPTDPLADEESTDQGVEPEVDGAVLFKTQCSSCHGLDGTGVEGRGPSLEPEGEAAADFVLRTGRMPLAALNLQANAGPVRYSEEEIVALVDHVASIGSGPATPEIDIENADVTKGGELYRLNCAACHVASGAGAPIGSGQIAPNLLGATPTEIGQAIVVGPGAMPVFGEFEEEELSDIAAYIHTALAEPDTTSARRFGGAGPAAEGLAAWLLALLPLVALTRWIGRPKEGRDHQGDADPPDADRPMETDDPPEVLST